MAIRSRDASHDIAAHGAPAPLTGKREGPREEGKRQRYQNLLRHITIHARHYHIGFLSGNLVVSAGASREQQTAWEQGM